MGPPIVVNRPRTRLSAPRVRVQISRSMQNPITSNGARSVYHAAIDELNRRYGDRRGRARLDEYAPPRGVFLVARVDTHPVGGVGLRSIA